MKLKKELGLFDVFSISTGAMFSSGFFLLPGLASLHSGPSVIIAYFLAGLLILPAMFSIAEIATALPRAGGTYYFLDRALGPLMGTIGGIGKYFALSLKTAFALVGIGAYASLFWEIPIKEIAVIFALAFMVVNIFGARKSSGVQKVFVIVLLVVITAFIIDGLVALFLGGNPEIRFSKDNFTPFLGGELEGLIFTTGFVFVSYLGLTQIASVAEEIKNPERNIPLGMALSLAVTIVIYTLGVFVMVAVIGPEDLSSDLSPVATAAGKLFTWLPGKTGLYIVVVAAIFAFASTGNAGMLSTSRYPLAMSRDKLFSQRFSSVSRFGSPIPAILLTAGIIILFILFLSEEGIVKLASTFQLFIFIVINFAVIVFRNSKITTYDPGYHSPLYPWMQIFGIVSSFALMFYMGWKPVVFTLAVILLAYFWFRVFVKAKVKREGAIYHWFALLGKNQHVELESEFMTILREKGLRHDDPFNQTLVKAKVIFLKEPMELDQLITKISSEMAGLLKMDRTNLESEFSKTTPIDVALTVPGVSIHYAASAAARHPSLFIVVSEAGIPKTVERNGLTCNDNINVFFFLVNSPEKPRLQLRILTGLLDIAERDHFIQDILSLNDERKIIEYMLHGKQYISLTLTKDSKTKDFINKRLMDVSLPRDVLVVFVERGINTFPPNGKTRLKENDVLTIIGETASINQLYDRYFLENP